MPLQIANPRVVDKVERLARRTGLSKTAVVEQAIDKFDRQAAADDSIARIRAAVAQISKLPERPDAYDPLEWDENGLPI